MLRIRSEPVAKEAKEAKEAKVSTATHSSENFPPSESFTCEDGEVFLTGSAKLVQGEPQEWGANVPF